MFLLVRGLRLTAKAPFPASCARGVPSRGCRSNCRCSHCAARPYSTDQSSAGSRPPSEKAAASPANPGTADGTSQLGELESKIAELRESYLRSLADMENLRQRTRREVEAAKMYGHQAFARDVIGVADVLEMALGAVKKLPEVRTGEQDVPHTPISRAASPSERPVKSSTAVDADARSAADHRLQDLIDGLGMTLEEARRVFSKHGITAIDPLHQKFDPNMHTALFEVPTEGVEEGTVVVVQKRGYLLHQRLLRPASVGVSKAASSK